MHSTYAQTQKTAQKKEASTAAAVLDVSSQNEGLQRKADMMNNAAQREEASRPNNTGMPDNLKSGIESLSGFSMDDVRVHYNSSKPATVQALAYTQGTDIHVAPGQEKHLPHEAWHVAQQMAGRVSPTTNINGMPVNDNAALEHEADVMGEKAVMQQIHNKNIYLETNMFDCCISQRKGKKITHAFGNDNQGPSFGHVAGLMPLLQFPLRVGNDISKNDAKEYIYTTIPTAGWSYDTLAQNCLQKDHIIPRQLLSAFASRIDVSNDWFKFAFNQAVNYNKRHGNPGGNPIYNGINTLSYNVKKNTNNQFWFFLNKAILWMPGNIFFSPHPCEDLGDGTAFDERCKKLIDSDLYDLLKQTFNFIKDNKDSDAIKNLAKIAKIKKPSPYKNGKWMLKNNGTDSIWVINS